MTGGVNVEETTTTQQVLDSEGIAAALRVMASEIAASLHPDGASLGGPDQAPPAEVFLVGVHTGGVPLAHRLAEALEQAGSPRPVVGMIDITLYRDDALMGLPQPIVGATELGFDVSGRRLVLVDDVLYTGRTIRAALDALIDFGRPLCIELAVLVDRGHRELPIQPTYVGCRVATARHQRVEVALRELGASVDAVVVTTRGGGA